MVGTSGGGFDLMCESISLAGMTETPITVFVGSVQVGNGFTDADGTGRC